jgi:predicted DCC family thiol-disulfide oxidoreductase YuxK
MSAAPSAAHAASSGSGASRASRDERLVVLLDGNCGICRRLGAWVHARDAHGRIELLPLQDPKVAVRFPSLALAELETALHVVASDGRLWRGAAACGAIVRALPAGRWWSWIFALPGAEWAYAQVASRRARTGCEVPATKSTATP